MIKDIISFSLANDKFAVDLLKTPLILSASKYLPKDFNNNQHYYFQFEDFNVEIINLHRYLNKKFNSITNTTKILVGYYENSVFGLLVDKVDEIINLHEECEKISLYENGKENDIVSGEILITDEIYKLIDVNKLIKKTNLIING